MVSSLVRSSFESGHIRDESARTLRVKTRSGGVSLNAPQQTTRPGHGGWRYTAYFATAFGQTLVPVGAVPTSWRTASLSVVQP